MALELFKPFIMKKLVDKDIVLNIKKAKTLVEQEAPEVFAILDEVVREHPVMLYRAQPCTVLVFRHLNLFS